MGKKILNRVKEVREKKGLTTTEVAERGGCSQGEVTQVENGKKIPNQYTISRLLKGLGVPAHKVHTVFKFDIDNAEL